MWALDSCQSLARSESEVVLLLLRGTSEMWPCSISRYGAAFGMLASHEDSRYSRFGQVLDDVERSCRFYEQDGKTVRLGRLQVYKRRGLDSKDS